MTELNSSLEEGKNTSLKSIKNIKLVSIKMMTNDS